MSNDRSVVGYWTLDKVAQLGMILFIAAETMFFAGLISAYLVFRGGSAEWPPAGQPRLPLALTAFNTIVLLVSAYFMNRAVTAFRDDRRRPLCYRLGLTAVFGALFLVLQGTEWIRLVKYGLTLTSSIYGALFYTLIGIHGLHVLGGLMAVIYVLFRSVESLRADVSSVGVELCRMYWNFVVILWPILYVLVYIV